MSWATRYVGIPYADLGRSREGCDCWGLARLVYAAELAIDLPSYAEDYVGTAEAAELANLIQAERKSDWCIVPEVQPFDLVLCRRGPHASHVGLALGPRAMLHMDRGDQSKVVPLTDARWARRIVGVFRHRDRIAQVPA